MEVLRRIFTKRERGKEKTSRDFPTTMVVGIDTIGRIDLPAIRSLVKAEDKELVVFGVRSPAFRNAANVILEHAPKFSSDPHLVMVFEKYPNRNDPFATDPFIMVRRTFLLGELEKDLEADSLGKLVIRLAMAAGERYKIFPI